MSKNNWEKHDKLIYGSLTIYVHGEGSLNYVKRSYVAVTMNGLVCYSCVWRNSEWLGDNQGSGWYKFIIAFS